MAVLRIIVRLSYGPLDGVRYDSMATPENSGDFCGESRISAQGIYAATRGEVGKVIFWTAPFTWHVLEDNDRVAFKSRPFQQHEYQILRCDEADNLVIIQAEHVGLYVTPVQ